MENGSCNTILFDFAWLHSEANMLPWNLTIYHNTPMQREGEMSMVLKYRKITYSVSSLKCPKQWGQLLYT